MPGFAAAGLAGPLRGSIRYRRGTPLVVAAVKPGSSDRPPVSAPTVAQITVLERRLGKTRPRFCPSDRAFLTALLTERDSVNCPAG
jgi:hypothetical protein